MTDYRSEYITFTVRDHNWIMKNQIIGIYRIRLRDLLDKPKGSEISASLVSEASIMKTLTDEPGKS
jgi:hypothetical protein